MKGRSWWVIALIFVSIFATVSGLIYLAIRLTREQRRSGNKGPYMPPASIIPPPISWAYDTFVSTLPQSGVIKDNVIPNALATFMKKNAMITTVTETYPPTTKQEREEAQKQSASGHLPTNFLGLKWGVLAVHTRGDVVRFKDLIGRQSGSRGVFALSKWDWANPKPENGVVNRHAGGLDPVDWSSFDSACKLIVLSRGVTTDLRVRYEQVHAIRGALNNPIVLVLNSSLAVDVINQLFISQFDEGLCFLLHSTC